MKGCVSRNARALSFCAAWGLFGATSAYGQTGPSASNKGPVDADEILVTATKKSVGERVQEVPIAMTALSGRQLDDSIVRDLSDLTYKLPNVQFDTLGVSPGTVNYSIRGLGTVATAPTTEPYVGVFVDGVYLGIPNGLGGANFDVESIQVLRGPQGVLFGRNVVGGAVVIQTSNPSNEPKANLRVGIESGLNKIASAVITGPIIKDILAAKIALYYSHDDGYFFNDFNRKEAGGNEQYIIRPALLFTPGNSKFILKFEKGKMTGDGTPAQNSVRSELYKDFNFSSDDVGSFSTEWNQAILEADINVGFGDGVITNIVGYRDTSLFQYTDIDALPANLFRNDFRVMQNQISNELRYSGTFGPAQVTVGLFYFDQFVTQAQQRTLFAVQRLLASGRQNSTAFGAFSAVDWHITDTLTLNTGLRYSWEEKKAQVTGFGAVATSPCNFLDASCTRYDFNEVKSWSGLAPKLGFQWEPDRNLQIYASYSKGIRSGGYNISAAPIPPELNPGNLLRPVGPVDQETADSYEIGFKHRFGKKTFINAAIFQTNLSNVQRQIIAFSPLTGTSTFLTNAGDLRLRGFEIEAQAEFFSMLTLAGQVGHMIGDYTRVQFDLNGDGSINAADMSLQTPRLAPWSYGISATLTHKLKSVGSLSVVVDYDHRDGQFTQDNNSPNSYNRAVDFVNVRGSVTTADDKLRLSVYAKNLTNQVTYSGPIPLPAAFGGAGSTFRPLNRGRIVGVELSFNYP